MSDAPIAPQKVKRDRSPSFPFISLKVAVSRLAAFEDYFKRHPAPAKKAGLAWGMKADSSQAAQTLAALKAFGFIEYTGSGSDLQASISESGRTLLRAQQESVKREILQNAALQPKVIAKYWHVWNADRPQDPICLDDLVLKGAFTEAAAKLFLSVYDDTISFAGLSYSDKSESEGGLAPDLDDDGPVDAIAQSRNETSRSMPPPPPPLAASVPPPIGKPRIVMNGDHLDIHASVDLDGLKQLQTMLKKYEEILEMMSPKNEEAGG